MNVLPRTSATMEAWNRKRSYEDDLLLDLPSPKRPKYYHVRLESECSSITSEGEESIHTIQDQETDLARDPSDTDTKSEDSDYELIEYEVASLEESDGPLEGYLSTSSGSEDILPGLHLDIEDVVAAVLGDTSLDAWGYDTGHSSTDEMDDSKPGRQAEFKQCAECKGENDVPQFRLCTSCFQVRKKFYPPRPRRFRKQRSPDLNATSGSAPSSSSSAVNIEKLKSCLDGISQEGSLPSSQDSGLGGSQEIFELQLDKIVVPEAAIEDTKKRRRSQDENLEKSSKIQKQNDEASTEKELCTVCMQSPRNGAVIHGNTAHVCCCYKCAIKCWKLHKKCPVCNRNIKSVVKVFNV
ncbi:E3 ubiquitin-protein ligase Mdm2-like isoform X2 [Onthophagus taurus]|uniref:E3 ubiquitin-protein ligase Mdm2-like isoform X2 n=1 Tax=Onthophagus taurus TaxID=166361 RepID=UPI000C20B312|nr:E3 ubiquitin-protein ligase Mdm2-like isoform X2 [Onthophagus taurus]